MSGNGCIDVNALARENVELRQKLAIARRENDQHRERMFRIARAADCGDVVMWDVVPGAVERLADRAKTMACASDVLALTKERDELKGRLLNLATFLGGFNFPIPEDTKATPEERAENIIRHAHGWLNSHRELQKLQMRSVMGPPRIDTKPQEEDAHQVVYAILRDVFDQKAAGTIARAITRSHELRG